MKTFKTTTETYDIGNEEKKYKAEKLLKEYNDFKVEKIPYMILSKWDLFLISKGVMKYSVDKEARTLTALKGINEYENIKAWGTKNDIYFN